MDQAAWADLIDRCHRLLDGLDVPQPFTAEGLCAAVAKQRDRPLRLFPLPGQTRDNAGVCGAWVALGTVDHIYYQPATSPVHQTHIVLHELAHMLLGHRPEQDPGMPEVQQLFPDLDPAMAARLLGLRRTASHTQQEQEAELLASLMRHRFDVAAVATADASPSAAKGLRQVIDAFSSLYRQRTFDETL